MDMRRSRSPSRRDDSYQDGSADGRRSSYRRRSPSNFDRRGRLPPRNRSRSPPSIDQYRPGGRDGFRRRSPPAAPQNIDRYVPGHEPPLTHINPIPNPMQMEFPAGFSYFAEWWRKEQEMKDDKERRRTGVRRPLKLPKTDQELREEKEQIQAAYDSYREKQLAKMARDFVQNHKTEEWFKEKYDAAYKDPIRKQLSEFRSEAYKQWLSDLSSGMFDEFTLEGIYKNESDGAGGVVDKEEGETTAAAEILGVGDLVPAKGGDLKDEAMNQPSLLIKTIAPYIPRAKLEQLCKDNLGDSEGGFKWLSLSDPNPSKKCHRIGWVLLNPGDDIQVPAVKKDPDESMNGDEEGEEKAENNGDTMDTTEGGDTEIQTVAQRALSQVNGKSISVEDKGEFTCHVGVHTPTPNVRKKALWDLFSAPERVERDLQLAVRLVAKLQEELGDQVDGLGKIEEKVNELLAQGSIQPVGGASKVKTKPEDEEPEEGEEEGEEIEEDDENDDQEMLLKKKKLDLIVEYLRRVFNFCFFCVFESDSVHELMRKCPGGHLRRPRASLTTSAKTTAKASALGEPFPFKKDNEAQSKQENGDESPVAEKPQNFQRNSKTNQQLQKAYNWVRTYEDKLFQILEPESVDLKKIGGRPIDEFLEKELKKFVKQEDEAKFRCQVPDCSKLFKGETFWRKHVEKRHADWYEALIKDIKLINSYVLDPSHVTGARGDAASNGHFPVNHTQPTGTPRGFNFSNMQAMSLPGMAGAMPGFPGQLGGMPFAMGAGPMGGSGMGGPGPMRRGNRYNNHGGTPYDRQGGSRSGGGRFGGDNGRLSPPRAGGMRAPGRGSHLDALPGNMNAEAIQGRSVKSYQDLDAVGDSKPSGGGGLDY